MVKDGDSVRVGNAYEWNDPSAIKPLLLNEHPKQLEASMGKSSILKRHSSLLCLMKLGWNIKVNICTVLYPSSNLCPSR